MAHSVDLKLKTSPASAVATRTEPATLSGEPERALRPLPIVDLRVKQQRSLWGNAWRQFRRHKLAMAGLVLFIFMFLATFVGSSLYPQKIDTIDFSVKGNGISWDHPFGTDSLGRDMLARMLWGGRISLAVGIVAALVAIILGTTIG